MILFVEMSNIRWSYTEQPKHNDLEVIASRPQLLMYTKLQGRLWLSNSNYISLAIVYEQTPIKENFNAHMLKGMLRKAPSSMQLEWLNQLLECSVEIRPGKVDIQLDANENCNGLVGPRGGGPIGSTRCTVIGSRQILYGLLAPSIKVGTYPGLIREVCWK